MSLFSPATFDTVWKDGGCSECSTDETPVWTAVGFLITWGSFETHRTQHIWKLAVLKALSCLDCASSFEICRCLPKSFFLLLISVAQGIRHAWWPSSSEHASFRQRICWLQSSLKELIQLTDPFVRGAKPDSLQEKASFRRGWRPSLRFFILLMS